MVDVDAFPARRSAELAQPAHRGENPAIPEWAAGSGHRRSWPSAGLEAQCNDRLRVVHQRADRQMNVVHESLIRHPA